MKPICKQLTSLIYFLALCGFGQAYAEDYLTADQVSKLITGNTIHAKHLIKGFEFKVYFDPDGNTAYRHQNGETTETIYQFYGNEHCLRWGGKDRCANILDNKDGTYTRVKGNGKRVVIWNRIVNGKDL